jgi:hypothetical protein
MDRFWGGLAGCLTVASCLALWFGAWGWSLVLGFVGGIITGLLAYEEFVISLGPVGMLRSGKVWAIDVGRRGVYGIGLNPRHVRLRRVKAD